MKYIRSEQGINLWKIYHDDTNTYEANVVLFDKPSIYGINGGKIAKLFIKRVDDKADKKSHRVWLYAYDKSFGRNIETVPTEEVKSFYTEIISALN